MGTTSHDKISKKRKRSQIEDESFTEELSSGHEKSSKKKRSEIDNDSFIEEHASNDGTSPKKKKKRKSEIEDESFTEHTPANDKSSKKKKKSEMKDSNISSETFKSKSTGTSEKMTDDDRLHSLTDDLEEDNSTEKQSKKEGKKRKRESLNNNEEDGGINSESKKEKKQTKTTKKGTKELQNSEEDVGETEPVQKKKGKKKGEKESSSFGVVDTKLLRDHGGEDVEAKKKTKKRKPNQVNRALDYLHLWKNNFKSWKFSKLYQARLIKILYNDSAVTDEDFESCLEYFEKSQGRVREQLKSDAMAVIDEDESVDREKEKRARQILQMLG